MFQTNSFASTKVHNEIDALKQSIWHRLLEKKQKKRFVTATNVRSSSWKNTYLVKLPISIIKQGS